MELALHQHSAVRTFVEAEADKAARDAEVVDYLDLGGLEVSPREGIQMDRGNDGAAFCMA